MSGKKVTVVYTDGSCFRNGQPGAKAGYGTYWYGTNHTILNTYTSPPVDGPATNNRGEIQGARQAIRGAGRAGVTDLRINTDSDFVKKSIESYIPRWKQNNFIKSNGERVVNEQDFRALDREMNNYPNMNVEFRHVPGHSGNQGNECADRLAKEGARQYNNGY